MGYMRGCLSWVELRNALWAELEDKDCYKDFAESEAWVAKVNCLARDANRMMPPIVGSTEACFSAPSPVWQAGANGDIEPTQSWTIESTERDPRTWDHWFSSPLPPWEQE